MTHADRDAGQASAGDLSTERYFAGPGESRARCRAIDWARTPLGPVATWSPALRAAVRLCLDCARPMCVFGGPALVAVYNDAYAAAVGSSRHPHTLGRPAREGWGDLWEAIGPGYEQVMAGGPAVARTTDASFVVDRGRGPEETWWTWATSPLRDDEGRVIGCHTLITETTARVQAERRAEGILERMKDAHCVLDRDFTFVRVNAAAERVLGRPRKTLLGRSHWEVFPASVDAPVGRALRRVVEDGIEQYLVHHYAGEGYDLHLELDAYPTDEGGVAMFWRDVTERVRAEAALRESEAQFQALFAAAPVPFLVLAADPPDFTITAVNDAYLAATLTTREGLIGRRMFDVFTDNPTRQGMRGSEALAISLDRVLRERRTDVMPRVRYDLALPGDGFEPHWWDPINAPLLDADGRVTAIIHHVTRVTELHHAEGVAERERADRARDELRRQLAAAEEAERRRLARELHDQLGQHLTAFALGLSEVRRLVAAGQSVEAHLARLEELSHMMTRDARYLALELRPPELDDVGLESALRTYVEQWSARYGVAAEVAITVPEESGPIPGEASTAIYRIVQEALTNVAKHARASHVSVMLDRPDGEARLIVEDDGQGFDPVATGARVRREQRLGLASIRERVALVGGTLEIESSPEGGTSLYVRVPLRAGKG